MKLGDRHHVFRILLCALTASYFRTKNFCAEQKQNVWPAIRRTCSIHTDTHVNCQIRYFADVKHIERIARTNHACGWTIIGNLSLFIYGNATMRKTKCFRFSVAEAIFGFSTCLWCANALRTNCWIKIREIHIYRRLICQKQLIGSVREAATRHWNRIDIRIAHSNAVAVVVVVRCVVAIRTTQ